MKTRKSNVSSQFRRLCGEQLERRDPCASSLPFIDIIADAFIEDAGYGPVGVGIAQEVSVAFTVNRRDLSGCTSGSLNKMVLLSVPRGWNIEAPVGATLVQEDQRAQNSFYLQNEYTITLDAGETVTFHAHGTISEFRDPFTQVADFASIGTGWNDAKGVYRDPDMMNGSALVNRDYTVDGEIPVSVFHAKDWTGIADFAASVTPYDVNHDGETTSLDVLNVINELNEKHDLGNGGTIQVDETNVGLDVNGDDVITSMDALTIINQLNLRESCDSTIDGSTAYEATIDAAFADMY